MTMWTRQETMVLNAILDELIPPSADGRIPGAGQLGVASFFATASAYAPHPTEAVRCVLDYVQSVLRLNAH